LVSQWKFASGHFPRVGINISYSGGYTALSTKGVASLLSYKFFHMVTFPVTYLLIAVLVSTALLQIKYLNRALQRFDSTQVIPTQFVLFTLSVIIGSTVLYRDFEKATSDRVIKFVAGCMLTFAGVYLITSNRPRSQDYDEEFEADEEAAIGLVGREGECLRDVDSFPVDDIWDRGKPAQDAELDGDMSEEEGEEEDGEISPSRRGPHNGGDSVHSLPRRLNSQSSRSSIPSEVSSLLENPWQASGMERPFATPPKTRLWLHGTSSESPSVSGTRTPRDQDPPEVSLTRSSSQPLQTDAPTTPATPAPRNSLSLMMPGPLPLSSPFSSLTAVVADELRRGVDNVPSPSRKRHSGLRVPRSSSQPSTRKAKSPHAAGQGDAVGSEGIASRPQQTPSRVAAEVPGPVNTGKGRARKLSLALSDFVRRKKANSTTVEGEQSESGEENGR
jgi:magnesium transporter